MDQWVHDNLIFKGLSGSRAYGTHTSKSDYDYRGVTIPPKEYLLGLKKFEQFQKVDGEDITIYALNKFFNLLLGSNPNILELIFLPEDCIIVTTPQYDKLIANREIFLSKKALVTFSGYATAQFKKMKAHKERLEHPPRRPRLENFALPTSSGEDMIMYDKVKYKQALDVYKKYENWKETAKAAKDFNAELNYDTKNAMHLIRLLNSGKSLISTGEFQVRSPIRGLLLDIRNGKYSYDQVMEMYQQYNAEFEEAAKTSPLPKTPNANKANQLCIELTEEMLFST